ncbi:hypothetical protein DL98DRAFT_588793 [Cadophora sp. DSE1049]|nr:hypothetical protein DL98DRAFT_588793 [Cadophora sp. DSE1049]
MKSRSSRRAPSGRGSSSNTQSLSSSAVPTPQLTSTAVLLISQDGQALAEIQVGATTFTLFPTMPLELRSKVWGHSFEEIEAICIEHKVYKSDIDDDSNKAFVLENQRALPVALFVNQESRRQALSKHTILYRSQIPAAVKYDGPRPICAKASDIFWIEFLTLMNSPDELYDWLSAVKTYNSGFVDKVTKLEVRGTFTQMFFTGVLNSNKDKCMKSGDADPFRNMKFASFLLFPALKEITFTGKNGDKDWVTPLGRNQLEQLKAWIVVFLEKLKAVFKLNGGAAPTVTFRPFKNFQKLIDE